MLVKTIDLSKYCNHKLLYENIPTDGTPFGLDNICILKQDYLSRKKDLKQNTEYNCRWGEHDNVVCDMQSVMIGSKVKRWHFLGFSYWGNVNELFRVLYAVGTESYMEVTFVDWSQPYIHDPYETIDNHNNIVEDIFNVVSTGEKIHPIYFHDSIVMTQNEKIVKEIILPNNILVHIFALTIEY